MNKSLFAQIQKPQDIQKFTVNELETLAAEIRQEIIRTVSITGGHLASSLGVVELTLALLKVFDPSTDRIVWDVGHQTYAYKILTQGLDKFQTLRQFQGMSGFPKLSDSPFDHFGVGHSSTSISAALGMAVGRDFSGQSSKVLAIIGDGSLTAGIAYEGLNQAGDLDRDLIVILNDNEMSISKNVGALSSLLSRKLSDQRFVRLKEDIKKRLRQVPRIGNELVHYARRSEESLKSLFTPGMLFEAFKFNYLGPIDGHNLRHLIKIFEQIHTLQKPLLIHTLTTKGKGYTPAESNPTKFHGVGCFEPRTGERVKGPGDLLSYSQVFGSTLCQLAHNDSKIVAITAAMPEGTGLDAFAHSFPDRFFDVGICEQHAVTFAAGLAIQGFKPVVCIYSTFLQRAYDQIVHDVCLQNLPVIFCLDRSGLVGEDGPTHHGSFDISYLRHITNMTVMAPKDEPELQSLLISALDHAGPSTIRYPRGTGPGHALTSNPVPVPYGQGELVKKGDDGLIISLGKSLSFSLEAANALEKENNLQVSVFNLRFVKPLPEKQLQSLLPHYSQLFIVEENALAGGAGSAILEFLADTGLSSHLQIKRIGIPDRFIEHGTIHELQQMLGLDSQGIKKAILEILQDK
jgi:1-deoxy-D-xylulose-5-phosphate synthase